MHLKNNQSKSLENPVANEHEWLFMLYLSGDNNLSSEMVRALKDIQDEDPPCGIKMTTLYDALSPCCPTYVYDFSGESQAGPHGAEPIAPNLLNAAHEQRTEISATEPNESFPSWHALRMYHRVTTSGITREIPARRTCP